MHAIRQHELDDPAVHCEEVAHLGPGEGQIRITVNAIGDAAGAPRDLEARKTHGKVVLIPDAKP